MSKHHELKCVQPYFDEVKKGNKTFEVRFNDRDYQVGDTFSLRCFDIEKQEYTGLSSGNFEITYVLKNYFALRDDYCVLGFKKIK